MQRRKIPTSCKQQINGILTPPESLNQFESDVEEEFSFANLIEEEKLNGKMFEDTCRRDGRSGKTVDRVIVNFHMSKENFHLMFRFGFAK